MGSPSDAQYGLSSSRKATNPIGWGDVSFFFWGATLCLKVIGFLYDHGQFPLLRGRRWLKGQVRGAF